MARGKKKCRRKYKDVQALKSITKSYKIFNQ